MPTLCESIGPKKVVNSRSAMVESRMTDFDGHQSIGFCMPIVRYLVGGFKHEWIIFHFIYGIYGIIHQPLTLYF